MKRPALLIAALAFTLTSLQARVKRTDLTLANAIKEWNADHLTFADDGKTITFNQGSETKTDDSGNSTTTDAWGNAAVSWFRDTQTDLSAYTRIVLQLEEASTSDVELVVSNGGYWGIFSSNVLKTGATELSVELKDLVYTTTPGENDTYKKGDPVDLTKVNMVFLRTGWVHEQTIKIKAFYLEKEITDYDQVQERDATDASLFPLTEGGLDLYIWNTNDKTNAYDAPTKTLTFGSNYCSIGWSFTQSQDLSGYKTLAIDLQQPIADYVQLRFLTADGTVYSYDPSLTATQIRLNLSDAVFAYNKGKDENGNDTKDITNATLPLKAITKVYFWNSWAKADASIKLDTVYLVHATKKAKYLLRENLTAKYGTVCLPFAAAKPSNATIYEVRGIDSQDSPTKLYVGSVESLTAGKAYIYESHDEQDVSFDKVGETADLTSPSAATGGLMGTFDQCDAPVGNYILVGGQWKKVAADHRNKVGKYRASLSLTGLSVISDEQANGKLSAMDLFEEGTTTGLQGVEARQADTPCYTLGGLRTAKPSKGVYVKNGKKRMER